MSPVKSDRWPVWASRVGLRSWYSPWRGRTVPLPRRSLDRPMCRCPFCAHDPAAKHDLPSPTAPSRGPVLTRRPRFFIPRQVANPGTPVVSTAPRAGTPFFGPTPTISGSVVAGSIGPAVARCGVAESLVQCRFCKRSARIQQRSAGIRVRGVQRFRTPSGWFAWFQWLGRVNGFSILHALVPERAANGSFDGGGGANGAYMPGGNGRTGGYVSGTRGTVRVGQGRGFYGDGRYGPYGGGPYSSVLGFGFGFMSGFGYPVYQPYPVYVPYPVYAYPPDFVGPPPAGGIVQVPGATGNPEGRRPEQAVPQPQYQPNPQDGYVDSSVPDQCARRPRRLSTTRSVAAAPLECSAASRERAGGDAPGCRLILRGGL